MILNRFINALSEGDRGEAVIIGVPFDGVASARPGACLGPDAIRKGSTSLETFSPYLDRDLAGRDYLDWGNIDIPGNDFALTMERIEERVSAALAAKMSAVILGGGHCQTVAVVRAFKRYYPNLMVLQLDAHLGHQDNHNGQLCNHSTVMRMITEEISPDHLFRFGARSGSREEFQAACITLPLDPDSFTRNVEQVLMNIPQGLPLFVSLDFDVFDPSLIPGVVNPVPWGLTWREFIQIVRGLTYRNLVGFEVVELVPELDASGVSALVAASAVRELMLSLLP